MSGIRAGRRRTRAVIQPVAALDLKAPKGGEDDDTRTDRVIGDIADRVNELIDKVQDNIDLGNLE